MDYQIRWRPGLLASGLDIEDTRELEHPRTWVFVDFQACPYKGHSKVGWSSFVLPSLVLVGSQTVDRPDRREGPHVVRLDSWQTVAWELVVDSQTWLAAENHTYKVA